MITECRKPVASLLVAFMLAGLVLGVYGATIQGFHGLGARSGREEEDRSCDERVYQAVMVIRRQT